MTSFKSNFFFFITAIILFNCSTEKLNEQPSVEINPSEYYQELDIPYGDNPDQKFDLYLPANRTLNTKVIILVHGGGWTSGDKKDMNFLKDFLRQDFSNLAIANINYRLADEDNAPFPMQINDITSIINYLNDYKGKYTISNNIGFIGTSAGAHLSLLWSYAFDDNNSTNMVCSIVGPTNFTDPAYLNNTDPDLQELISVFGMDPAISFLEEVSPLHQVTSSAPPTILFYGGQDPLIPTTQGTGMRDKLESLGVTHEFTSYPDAGHGWTGLELLDTWTKLKVFINTHL